MLPVPDRGKVKLLSQSVTMVTYCVNLTCLLAASLKETSFSPSSPLYTTTEAASFPHLFFIFSEQYCIYFEKQIL